MRELLGEFGVRGRNLEAGHPAFPLAAGPRQQHGAAPLRALPAAVEGVGLQPEARQLRLGGGREEVGIRRLAPLLRAARELRKPLFHLFKLVIHAPSIRRERPLDKCLRL